MNIPAQSLCSFTYTGEAGSLVGLLTGMNADDVRTAIITSLKNYGLPSVTVTCAVTGVLDNIFPSTSQPIGGAIQLRPSYDTTDDDLRASVAQAINDATGYAPSVTFNGSDAKAPDPTVNPNAPPGSFQDMINKFFAAIQSDVKWILIGGAGLVVVGVIVVGYAPNVKKLASVSL